ARRRKGVRAAGDRDGGRPIPLQSEWQIDGVQDEGGRPGGADGEVVLARLDFARLEYEYGRPDRASLVIPFADRRRGPDRRQVLGGEAWLLPIRPDVDDLERPAGEHRERQRRAEHLPATFALGTIDLDEGRHG